MARLTFLVISWGCWIPTGGTVMWRWSARAHTGACEWIQSISSCSRGITGETIIERGWTLRAWRSTGRRRVIILTNLLAIDGGGKSIGWTRRDTAWIDFIRIGIRTSQTLSVLMSETSCTGVIAFIALRIYWVQELSICACSYTSTLGSFSEWKLSRDNTGNTVVWSASTGSTLRVARR